MTDRTKTICPPIFDLGGIKKIDICNVDAFMTTHVPTILMKNLKYNFLNYLEMLT
jgi:hypothetical protein